MTSADSLQVPLEGFVARVQRETRVPGIGVAVSVAGERLEAYAGTGRSAPLDRAARYHMGCTTKLLLAMLDNPGTRPASVLLPTTLQQRASTAPPR